MTMAEGFLLDIVDLMIDTYSGSSIRWHGRNTGGIVARLSVCVVMLIIWRRCTLWLRIVVAEDFQPLVPRS